MSASERRVVAADLDGFYDAVLTRLAHDVKSPLSAIAMNIDFALRDIEPSETADVREALADCRAAGRRLRRMIENAVDVTRAASGRLELSLDDAEPRGIVGHAVAEAEPEAGARGVQLTPDVRWSNDVRVDVTLVVRALQSLVELLVRGVPDGASVVVSAEGRGHHLALGASTSARIAPIPVPLHAAAGGNIALSFCRAVAEAHGGAFVAVGASSSLPSAVEPAPAPVSGYRMLLPLRA